MKVSLSWLTEYVPVDMPPGEIAEALTMAGLEVESVVDRYDWLENVVSGRVKSVRPHPEADRLQLCEVEAGDGRLLSVVCGAPNVSENMVSALVLPGTELPGGMVVQKSRIRGQVSEGMLCSAAELGLGEDAAGIMVLDTAVAPGRPLREVLSLSDPVFDIDLTPNRPDCLSIIGVAREVAAFSGATLRRPEVTVKETGEDITELTAVTIEAPELCPRYAARVITDIAVGPSPFWLRDRLLSVGLKPINTVVDITNFVMMETGQPLHAFDLDRLADNRIVVRCAGETVSFTTLDEKERKLAPDMLMICDAEKPVAVAGVMGGRNSEISDQTTRVLIESACFKPASIRKTAKQLGMSSDAAYRFERGVDPLGTVAAVDRATQLMAALTGGRTARGVIDNHPRPAVEKTLAIRTEAVNRRLGTNLNTREIADFLEAVEFPTRFKEDEVLEVRVPSFRVDVERPEDISEEVARLWGYNRIPVTFPMVSAEPGRSAPFFVLRNRVRDVMTGFGFTETVNYSFVDLSVCEGHDPRESGQSADPLALLNPLASDQAVMRTSLIPGLLSSMQYNLSQQEKDLRLFEVGRVFWKQTGAELPREPEMVAGLQTGAGTAPSWLADRRETDFYDIKGAAEALLTDLGLPATEFSALPAEQCRDTKPGLTARIAAEEKTLGRVGAVSEEALARFGLKQPAFVFEINLSELSPLLPVQQEARPVSRFPAVFRDITVIVNRNLEAGRMLTFLEQGEAELIEAVRLVAVYEGTPIPPGKKSVSVRVRYRSQEGTLNDALVNRRHDFAAELPK